MYTFDSEKFAQQLQMSIREALNAPRKALCIKLENLRSNLHTMLIKALLPARDEPQEQLHHKQDRTMAKAALLANSIANLAETTTQILLIPTSRAAEPVERGSNPEENPTAASTEDELLATASPDD
eukprot:TRINITY_DN3852_c0_g1_i6.p1 TRINITY_DN3852_c0_g1~~TRINITY_DN3852_c0_g1_i6.p1  ORF type:complete len:126 (-),score=26.93 TRINITY_DN3852_c0_g1_i6:2211-2588(-)